MDAAGAGGERGNDMGVGTQVGGVQLEAARTGEEKVEARFTEREVCQTSRVRSTERVLTSGAPSFRVVE